MVCFLAEPAHQPLTCCVPVRWDAAAGGATVSAWEVRAKQKHDTGADLFPRESRGARLQIRCPGGDGRSAGRALCQPTAVRGSYFLSAAPEFLAVAAVPSRGAAVGPVQRGRAARRYRCPGAAPGKGGGAGRALAPAPARAAGQLDRPPAVLSCLFFWGELSCPVCSTCLVRKVFGEQMVPVLQNFMISTLLGPLCYSRVRLSAAKDPRSFHFQTLV